jgi:hypothetical protein
VCRADATATERCPHLFRRTCVHCKAHFPMRAIQLTAALLGLWALASIADGSATFELAQGREPLRIWIDEFFFASGETVLLREAAAATGGAATVAGSTHNRVMQLKSYQLADKVDVMWTGQRVGWSACTCQWIARRAPASGLRAVQWNAAPHRLAPISCHSLGRAATKPSSGASMTPMPSAACQGRGQ